MTDESTIIEMMEEMEAYFNERDKLFQERENAYRKRYDELIRRETDLKERERFLERTRKEQEARIGFLGDKEEEIRRKDEELKKKTSLREEEYSRLRKKMKENQLRLNLLETKLQNESLLQDVHRLHSGMETEEDTKYTAPALSCCLETELYEAPEYRALKEENRKITDENVRLYDELLSEMERSKALEQEKQELFKVLLEKDPDTAGLFADREKEETAEDGGSKEPSEESRNLQENADGERSEQT
ncbi:MAG: hypothetical protein IJI25_13170 [Eubacterium sp.]|nr:hypothetical protein [Eubacterium sp.]